ncbi:MAG: nucleotidyltransferase domain-containing protein [archaeon]|nr:MAG: nucleotidyltransferase domain-containing protein [archaeon]
MKSVLNTVIKKIKIPKSEEKEISDKVNLFINKLKKKNGFKILLGGSFAKKTLIKKKVYDVDIFIRFNKSLDPSRDLRAILKKLKLKYQILKGSRDYFQIRLAKNLIVELVPTLKISDPDQAKNITDISYFHVDYVLKKIKRTPKLADEIKLTKAFCFSQDCYGAESYIQGFSGYALEVLVSYYKTFQNFIRSASKWKGKEVLDPEKHYRNKNDILNNLNYAKLVSPLVVVDPTQASRNVTAAISKETYKRFINSCKKFLKKPSEKYFFKQKLDLSKWRGKNFFLIKAKAKSNKVDIAGAKIKKLFNFIIYKSKKNRFTIQKSYLDFNEENLNAEFFFVIKEPSKDTTVPGPPIKAGTKFVNAFKKKWKKTVIKNGRIYAKAKRETSFRKFFNTLSKDPCLKEMKIRSISLQS